MEQWFCFGSLLLVEPTVCPMKAGQGGEAEQSEPENATPHTTAGTEEAKSMALPPPTPS
jgi:hypothetical protein